MSETENLESQVDVEVDSDGPVAGVDQLDPAANEKRAVRRENRRWWIKLAVQPFLFLLIGTCLIVGLGVAQKFGYISAGGGGNQRATSDESVRYICPMMCTPPQSEPGRCPTCAMELVPATASAGTPGANYIELDPSARRVANIQTVSVKSAHMNRTIRAVGEISYDEGRLKTLSAYVDGRIDKLYADYTGVVVEENDHLALVFSPRLYSGQAEFLLAKKAKENSRNATLQRVAKSNEELYQSSKQRLLELGMTPTQVDDLENSGKASRQLHLCAPISGTVIEKLAVEGQYVKEGQPIYKLADLSTVWLMLELFPDDAASIQYGHRVEFEVQSLPGKTFSGRVAFVDTNVNPKTRTVGVRVVIGNEDGALRVGDYAKAKLEVPVPGQEGLLAVYDAELANKWISPRHPHVIRDAPGDCPLCGVQLVPATDFGFLAEEPVNAKSLTIPRDAVLMAGDNSVVYVEVDPGRFEIRRVVLGAVCGDEIVVLKGVQADEQVATRGNFLIDSQMQLAGNPSLIDPEKALPTHSEEFTQEMLAEIDKLPPADRALAKAQGICPVADYRLGAMGVPEKVDVNGRPIFICCAGCRDSLLEDPEKYLAKLSRPKKDQLPSGSGLPPIGEPIEFEMEGDIPPIGEPQLFVEDDDSAQQSEHRDSVSEIPPIGGEPIEVVR